MYTRSHAAPAPRRAAALVFRLLVIAALALGVAAGAAVLPGKSGRASAEGQFAPAPGDLKVVNYYPSDSGWTDMWNNYSHTKVDADFAAIALLNANAVRITVAPSAFGYPTVKPAARANLDDLMATAQAHGLFVQLTLFDWWTSYSDVTGSKQWLQSLLAGRANDQRIALVEVQNEITSTDPTMLSWTRQMLAFLPSVLPGVPRTVSIVDQDSGAGLKRLDAAIGSDLLDVLDLHLYGALTQINATIETAISLRRGRPIFVGEAGYSTVNTGDEKAQTDFLQTLAGIAVLRGISLPAPWTLNDFQAVGVMRNISPTESHFGLRRLDGSWKPAATVVRDTFSGGAAVSHPGPNNTGETGTGTGTGTGGFVPLAPSAVNYAVDGGFAAESARPDASGSLGQWQVYGVGSAEAAGTATGQGRSGTAGFITNTTVNAAGGSAALTQTLPLTGSQSVSVAGWVRLVGGVGGVAQLGSTRLSVSWFAGSTYLGQALSVPAVNTVAGWQQLVLTAQPPAGATSVQVHLNSTGNAGTAYFDDVSVVDAAGSSLVAGVPAAPGGGVNGAVDPGFENELSAPVSGSLGAWGVAGVGAAGSRAGQGRDGTNTVFLAGTGADAALTQSVPVVGAQSLTVAGWVRLAGGGGVSRVEVSWLAGDGAVLGQSVSPGAVNSLTGWQQLVVVARPPVGATSVQVRLVSAGNAGTAFFDDVSVSATTVSSPVATTVPAPNGAPNTAVDAGFENEVNVADASGTLGAWRLYNAALAGAGGTKAGEGRGGSNAAYLAATSSTSAGTPALSQTVPVTGSQSLTAQVWTRLVAGTGTTRISLSWFAGSTYLGQTLSPVASNSVTGWQLLSLTARPPTGASTVQMHVGSANNSGVAYFDEAALSNTTSALLAAAGNAALDPGFENETSNPDAGGVLGNWRVYNPSLAAASGTKPGQGRDSTNAGFLSGTTVNAAGGSAALTQTLPLTGSQSVSVAGWVRLVGGVGGVAQLGSTRLSVSWFAGSTYLGQALSVPAVNTVAGWQQLVLTAQPPAGATSVQVHLNSTGNAGTAYFDDVSVVDAAGSSLVAGVPAAPGGGVNGAVDPGFENELSAPVSGSLGAWGVAGVGAAGSRAGQGRDGTNTVFLAGTGADAALTQSVPVVGAQSLTVAGWVRLAGGGGVSRVEVSWLAGDGAVLGQSVSPGAVNSLTGWQQLVVVARPPVGATSVQVRLVSAGNAGTAFFDDVSVSATTVSSPVATTVPAPNGAPNTAVDAGFENEVNVADASGTLGAWRLYNAALAGAGGTKAGEGRGGSNAAYLAATSSTSAGTPALSQTVPVTGSQSLTAQVWTRLVAGTGTTRISLSWFAGSTYLGQTLSPVASNSVTGWQLLSLTARPPTGASTVQMHVGSANNSGVAYFDEAALSNTTSALLAAAGNAALDPGFENETSNPDAGGVLGNWRVYNPSLAAASGTKPGQGRDSTNAGFLSGTTVNAAGGSAALTQTLPLTGSQSVSVAGWVRLVGGVGGVAQLGSTRLSVSWFAGSTYLGQALSVPAVNTVAGWQQLVLTAQPPAGATSVQVHLNSTGNAGTAYFDDVTVAAG